MFNGPTMATFSLIDEVDDVLDQASLATLEEGGPSTTPERKLALAVLEQALHESQGQGIRQAAALRWIMLDDTRWPFSFLALTGQLGLDPDAIRDRIRGGRINLIGPNGHRRRFHRAAA